MKKEKFTEALLDVIVELVLTVVLFFIGWGFVKVFKLGKFIDIWDFELVCLLGFAILVVVIIVFYLVRKFTKRNKNEKFTEEQNDK